MALTYPVQRGAAYFAGLDLPFLLGAETIADAARSQGFTEVHVTPRDRARFAFEVRKVPGYADNWNAAFFGIYDGKRPTIEVPARPTWLFEVSPQIPPPGKSVVAQIVRPVRPGTLVATPASSRAVLWLAGIGLVVVAADALLAPVRGPA